ncbi:sorbosone dehydrogenase family protein [Clostridium sp.]|uniref:PQQ-dependent sugar dehydrogenase n=1 Tax=Clostridium sp. TaxID=1506 RepID=UPI001A38CAD1|nr:PQQ-dependent sugar dehydrogenase [Clostridium sp.]MBK5242736.1 PQQ-dependent sugar dehydrogenase [Clostridium sp.]
MSHEKRPINDRSVPPRDANVTVPPIESIEKHKRKLDPSDIKVPPGYKIDVFKQDLDTPINMIFTENGEMLVADAGVISGNGKVLRLTDSGTEIVAEGFNPPLTGINYHNGNIYVSHRGFITIIKPDGTKEDIVSGLPSFGDHHNNQVVFGCDGKMYFGQGTATNSGVVGLDNEGWNQKFPYFHDYPGAPIVLNGQNFKTKNIHVPLDKMPAYTGAYSPFGIPNMALESVKGIKCASGSILRANPDGSNLELVAWGLRNPFRMKFDRYNRLFCANHGADVRGSRPIDKCPDEFQLIMYGAWYGWPDYSGGMPVTLPIFKPEGMPQPTFLLAHHPMMPPKPFSNFPNHSATMGFDFNYNKNFDGYGDVYIAEFGSLAPMTTGGKPLPKVGHRVSRIDMNTGKIYIFAINKSGYAATYTGGGGFELPTDVIFDKSGSMYVVDFGLHVPGDPGRFIPSTGVIWKITKS